MSHDKRPKEEDHSFIDTTGRFPLDAVLRKHGFRILRRENRKEAVWVTKWGAQEFTQSEALATLPHKELRAAKILEEEYLSAKYG